MSVDEELAQLLLPLEEFTALHAATIRTAGSGLIDLSFPNPRVSRDIRGLAALREAAATLEQEALQYTTFGGTTLVRRHIAAALKQTTGMPYEAGDIFLTPGATAALQVVLRAIFRPGDEIVIVTPCWMDYPLYLRRMGLSMRQVSTMSDKRLDPAAVASAWGPQTAGLLISQPTCPTGVLSSASELAELASALAEVGARHGQRPVIVSDEVHRDTVWAETKFASPASQYPDTISIYSFGKAWALQGQRTGYLALSPAMPEREQLRRTIGQELRLSGFCAPTALMQVVAGRLTRMVSDHAGLAADQRYVRQGLADAGYEVVNAQATSFVYVRCPDQRDDLAFVTDLARRGLLAMPSRLFHEPGYFRLALNVASTQLDDVVEKLESAHDHRRAWPDAEQ